MLTFPKTLIVGLGKTGLSCVRFLSKQGMPIVVADTRTSPPGLAELQAEYPEVTLALGSFQPEILKDVERIIVSPGVATSEPMIQTAIERGIPVIGDIELFAQELNKQPIPTIAVTGSNGKSTVVSLLGAMAQIAGWQAGVGGNIGTPALELLKPEYQLCILELSSFQLETTYSLKPTAAVVLNISPDHMDRYLNLQAYSQTKARIYNNTKIAIYNRDDPLVNAMATGAGTNAATGFQEPTTQIGFTLNIPQNHDYGIMQHQGEPWLVQGLQRLLPIAKLKLPGQHNVANALVALALGYAVNMPLEAMLTALQNYTGLPHRTQLVNTRNGVRWYNDSKGTNPGATIAALQGLHPKQDTAKAVLIAGGESKNADFTELASVVAYTCRAVILFGRDASIIEAALKDTAELIRASDLAQAVQNAAHVAKAGDHVLFSPACASFDMFKNYEQRGEVFMQYVHDLD